MDVDSLIKDKQAKETARNRRTRGLVQESEFGGTFHDVESKWLLKQCLFAVEHQRQRRGPSKLDPWMMLDKRKNPKLRQDHLRWERLVRHKVELFASLNHWNRESVEATKTCGYVKFKLDTGAAMTAFPLDFADIRLNTTRTAKVTSQRRVKVFSNSEVRDSRVPKSWM